MAEIAMMNRPQQGYEFWEALERRDRDFDEPATPTNHNPGPGACDGCAEAVA
jgi:hypothetical protein